MPRLITKTEKEVKLNKKIKEIQDLYDLAFQSDCGNLIVAENFKLNLNMQNNQASLIIASQRIAKQVKLLDELFNLYPNEVNLNNLKIRLKQVHAEVVKLIKKEFVTIRTKQDLEQAKCK